MESKLINQIHLMYQYYQPWNETLQSLLTSTGKNLNDSTWIFYYYNYLPTKKYARLILERERERIKREETSNSKLKSKQNVLINRWISRLRGDRGFIYPRRIEGAWKKRQHSPGSVGVKRAFGPSFLRHDGTTYGPRHSNRSYISFEFKCAASSLVARPASLREQGEKERKKERDGKRVRERSFIQRRS